MKKLTLFILFLNLTAMAEPAPIGIGAIGVNNGNVGVNVGTSDPAIAAIMLGVGIATQPDYYKNNTISGTCAIVTSDIETIQTSCNSITIFLLDSSGKILTKTVTQNGEFAFRVPKDKVFGLSIDHPKYKLQKPVNSLELGDRVAVKLVKK